MNVYLVIVEYGYADRCVHGVYDSLDKAMAKAREMQRSYNCHVQKYRLNSDENSTVWPKNPLATIFDEI
jgi:hypothetical protein